MPDTVFGGTLASWKQAAEERARRKLAEQQAAGEAERQAARLTLEERLAGQRETAAGSRQQEALGAARSLAEWRLGAEHTAKATEAAETGQALQTWLGRVAPELLPQVESPVEAGPRGLTPEETRGLGRTAPAIIQTLPQLKKLGAAGRGLSMEDIAPWIQAGYTPRPVIDEATGNIRYTMEPPSPPTVGSPGASAGELFPGIPWAKMTPEQRQRSIQHAQGPGGVAERLAGIKAGAAETARTGVEEQARAARPFRRVYEGGIVVDLSTLQDVSSRVKNTGDAEALERAGTHVILTSKEALNFSAGQSALSAAQDIRDIGSKLFTSDQLVGVLQRGGAASLLSYVDLGPGRLANLMAQQGGRAFEFVRLMQRESRISDADMRIILQFMSIGSLMQSKTGFNERMDVLQKVLETAQQRNVHGVVVPTGAGITIPELGRAPAAGTPGPVAPGNKRYRRLPDGALAPVTPEKE